MEEGWMRRSAMVVKGSIMGLGGAGRRQWWLRKKTIGRRVVVNPAVTIKVIGHQRYQSAPLHEGDLSATKCLKNMVPEASGLPVISYSRSNIRSGHYQLNNRPKKNKV
ncbi:hypothetical protein Ccrd_007401 [Cynara cardunculus var. scolymus]|uniref:Uncharacterized protein n=1 Tax=Cynara cardunculus var. scolymus TaxID=59895 RepID=A0A103XGY1_CYNCS|nr:hypothetical protein Ccrd_007401 [Cynara cardunculus var. scolymus]